ncbi:protein neprosin isoform X2 [Elaeis guineensis]|uniref:Uncharacterized protein LOC105046496 isoform X2 n=1 Tax=Elaeis guineensis var. tenera TaxID=51953 RepID=A0A8N4F423_ELAGV|nr:uncharacterized protein LOC105046496 isoform X2 [Elaeis guineensis]
MKVHISMSHSLVGLFLVMTCLSCNMSKVWATTQQLEGRQHQKRSDKPIVKSIKSPDGDIIDCVHISHQPAFDHPLLENHTIQMRPSFYPLGLYDENNVESKMEPSSVPQLWHQKGRCPEDTIPIRRTKKAERYGKKRHRTIPNPTSAHPNQDDHRYEYAIIYTKGDVFYGAKGTINVWNPKVQEQDEYSTSQIWVIGGPREYLNAIEAGWHVMPSLYGDNKTRLFTFWTDPNTGNWWLQYGNRSPLGYWPSSLFSYLYDGASEVQWGGKVLNLNVNGQHTSTEMGSGHFSTDDARRASFIKNVQIVDRSNKLQTPPNGGEVMTQSACYDILNTYRGVFYYGGPGKNPNCP